jgi:hypothetical protein
MFVASVPVAVDGEPIKLVVRLFLMRRITEACHTAARAHTHRCVVTFTLL